MLRALLKILLDGLCWIPGLAVAVLFGRTRQRRALADLRREAGTAGFDTLSVRDTSRGPDARLNVTLGPHRISVHIQPSVSSNAGTYLSLQLPHRARSLLLMTPNFGTLSGKHLDHDSTASPFNTGHRRFDAAFRHRFSDPSHVAALKTATEFHSSGAAFYERWWPSLHEASIRSDGDTLQFKVRMDYGYPAHPFITAKNLRAVAADMAQVMDALLAVLGGTVAPEAQALGDALCKAAEQKDLAAVVGLLAQGVNLESQDEDLMRALDFGNVDVATLLINAGAIASRQQTDRHGKTAWDYAQGDEHILAMLESSASDNGA